MIVVTSRIRITSGNAEAVAEQYRRRLGHADAFPGCLGVEILRHSERGEEFLVYTRWADRDAYDRYRRDPAFRRAHQRIADIAGQVKIDPESRAFDVYEVLS